MIWMIMHFILRIPFWIVAKIKYKLKVSGKENVPKKGRFIVVSNHEDRIDPIAIALTLSPALWRHALVPWAKKEIGAGKEGKLGWFLYHCFEMIPIDRQEKNTDEAIIKSLKVLKKNKIVCVLPEGTRRRKLGKFKYGVANLIRACPFRIPILPVVVYRRDEDGGVQVKIGKIFYLDDRPELKTQIQEIIGKIGEKGEEKFDKQIDRFQALAESYPEDKKLPEIKKKAIKRFLGFLSKHEIDFDEMCHLAEKEDIEIIRKEVMKLLPPDYWEKVD